MDKIKEKNRHSVIPNSHLKGVGRIRHAEFISASRPVLDEILNKSCGFFRMTVFAVMLNLFQHLDKRGMKP